MLLLAPHLIDELAISVALARKPRDLSLLLADDSVALKLNARDFVLLMESGLVALAPEGDSVLLMADDSVALTLIASGFVLLIEDGMVALALKLADLLAVSLVTSGARDLHVFDGLLVARLAGGASLG